MSLHFFVAEPDQPLFRIPVSAKQEAARSLADQVRYVLQSSSERREFAVEVKDDQRRRILKALCVFDIEVD